MTLKGAWVSGNSYDAGDVVTYPDGRVYQATQPNSAPCADALYWVPLNSPLAECAKMCMDTLYMAVATVPTNISDEAITLKTDDGEYLITVDDSGETPELDVTLIEEEADEEVEEAGET